MDVSGILRGIGGLSGLGEASLGALIAASARLDFAPGETLMSQGAASDFADVLLQGEVEIYTESRSGAILIGLSRAPALVGELGAFAGLPRTASVRARSQSSVLRISKATLVEAALAAPALLIDALGRLGERLSAVNRAIGLYTHALAALERGEFTADFMSELRNPAPELVDFGETFSRIANEILLRRQRNDEMASAAIIQRALLPDPRAFAAQTGLDIHAAMSPARDVGGDFFDLVPLPDGRIALGVGDVCGKGVPAALYMGVSQTLIRLSLRERPDLAGAILKANDYLTAHYPADQFATLFYAAYDPRDGALDYVSCGHPAARIRRADGRIEALAAGGLPVGMFETLRVMARTARLETGDLLLIYSDGVTEAADPKGAEFGRERLEAVLSAAPADATAAVSAVVAAVTAFAGGAAQSDDITCVALARA